MANFIDKKEKEFQKQLADLSNKCKQNEVLNIISILGDDEIKILKSDKNRDVLEYIEDLKNRLYKHYDEMEVKNDK